MIARHAGFALVLITGLAAHAAAQPLATPAPQPAAPAAPVPCTQKRELQAQAWPTEDFELVTSHVETSLPEDDLFAGIRGR